MADQQFKHIGTSPIRPDGIEKVTGRAKFGADLTLPGMLFGKVVRSPHAHAVIKSIDTSKAEALAGVKSVMTSADIPEPENRPVAVGEMMINFGDLCRNVMAREKVFYDGHAVAAVAANTAAIAEEAAGLIEVEYEVLPHVIDVRDAIKEDAPILHDHLFTGGVEPKPEKPSNIANKVSFGMGDVEAGFAQADVIIEREFTTQAVHQGYIEPHAVVADTSEDGTTNVFCSSQGHFMVRSFVAQILKQDMSSVRVTPAEIGGGFGGKTTVYLEPLAVVLSRKAGRPVKMTMNREEVQRASGPTSGAALRVKMGATNDGKIVAGEVDLYYQAGAFPGSPVGPGCMTAFAPYDCANVKAEGYDVVSNRPKCVAYRAPGSPISAFAVESVVNEMAGKLGIDPLALREMNAAKEGTQAAYGPKFGPVGYLDCLAAAKSGEHYQSKLGPNQGRGISSGFWFNIGGESCADVIINEDGSVTVAEGSPDIGGSRASMAIMTAETLGIDYEKVKPQVVDTASTGYHFVTGGSRVTFATGMAVVNAAKGAIDELRARAAKIWDVDVEGVIWEDGYARPAGSNVGEMEPLSLAEIATSAAKTGGPIAGHSEINAQGAGPGFGLHICDVEVDPDTGKVTVLRYTAIQDVGRAIHKAYVEGQLQGGAVQGIGWALNEEYVYNGDGNLENAGFLDYRIPVASDLPMIETHLVEVPNPNHPYGVRGVGETPIIPPLAAVAGAVEAAIGTRMSDLPLSPPKILAAIDAKG
jgi:CO/xanthine dehydrogenase Mo-binding subunit